MKSLSRCRSALGHQAFRSDEPSGLHADLNISVIPGIGQCRACRHVDNDSLGNTRRHQGLKVRGSWRASASLVKPLKGGDQHLRKTRGPGTSTARDEVQPPRSRSSRSEGRRWPKIVCSRLASTTETRSCRCRCRRDRYSKIAGESRKRLTRARIQQAGSASLT